jgi:hypothetical protein
MEAQNGLTPRVVAAISGVQALSISAALQVAERGRIAIPPWFSQAVPPNWKQVPQIIGGRVFLPPKDMEGFRPPLWRSRPEEKLTRAQLPLAISS